MNDIDDLSIVDGRIRLGFLTRDLTFMSRVLGAHMRAINADFYREHDVVSGSVALLSLIGLNPGISQNDLAAAVVLKKSAVTKILTEMEQRGDVIREKPKFDRRYNALRLSEAGQRRWRIIRQQMVEQREEMLAPLAHRDREKLFQLLGRLVEHYADRSSAAGQRGGA